MSKAAPEVAPVLSTPDTHIFEDLTPAVNASTLPKLSDEQLYLTYEIKRTFPDEMLVDAPRVYEALRDGLAAGRKRNMRPISEPGTSAGTDGGVDPLVEALQNTSVENGVKASVEQEVLEKLTILADTSYGACCVDEIAAEHVDADVVVHYGRSCLSPTARLPVIYVFTTRPLDLDAVAQSFTETYPNKGTKTILMADIPYSNHIQSLYNLLQAKGYTAIYGTSIRHDPSSPLPNRTLPQDVSSDASALGTYSLFHISDPPNSLLLILSSRVKSIYIYPTVATTSAPYKALQASTAALLRRRYALLTSLSTCAIFGILINTLSVKNYLSALQHVQRLIANAGKKYYTFVVGKVNAAKVANFSEVGGWVVIGCWESSLIESREFWRPIITPFELGLALKGDRERMWTGEWIGDFGSLLGKETIAESAKAVKADGHAPDGAPAETHSVENGNEAGSWDSEEESEPPEFDLRTGRYVSHSRPMGRPPTSTQTSTKRLDGRADGADQPISSSLIKRANGDLTQIGGQVSPAAEFLRSKRTWQGLGSDYEIAYERDESGKIMGAQVEVGRSGIARGYAVGEETTEKS
ncbi:Diphthamide biosynthesis protein 2 [Elasticomyces elasticus]|nr:Diphthamide biosynthesis protein 2 [Elasticomyces elasticus]